MFLHAITRMTAVCRELLAETDTTTDDIDLFVAHQEISAAVAFIAGPESSYMNGSIVYADGGLAMGH